MDDFRGADGRATDGSATEGRASDGRAAEGFEHLQSAAHELIAAARVFLDAMEELIEEPEWVTNSVSGIVDAVKDLTGRSVDPWVAHARAAAAPRRADDNGMGRRQASSTRSNSDGSNSDGSNSDGSRSDGDLSGWSERQRQPSSTAPSASREGSDEVAESQIPDPLTSTDGGADMTEESSFAEAGLGEVVDLRPSTGIGARTQPKTQSKARTSTRKKASSSVKRISVD